MRGLMDEQAFVLTEPTGLRLQSLAQVVFSDLLSERKHSAVTQMYMIRVLPLTSKTAQTLCTRCKGNMLKNKTLKAH